MTLLRRTGLAKRSFRQSCMGSVFLIAIVLAFTACGNPSGHKKKETRPNFLVIIADDAGWNDVGYHGSAINTPNIDKLAGEGARLNRFYACPTCSPTRATLLTGKPASRMGILAPISGRSEKTLPDSLETLPQVLKKHGYKTALSGKWHLGLKPETGPEAYGFDFSYGFLHGQIDQYTHHYKNGDRSWHRNGEFIDEEGHSTDLITWDAIQQITRFASEKVPFYLQVAYSAPHTPLQEEEKWRLPYDTVFKEHSRQLFAAAMSHMDDGIGEIMKVLKEKGLYKNTVILFMSDNGAQHGWFPNEHLYNGRFSDFPVLGDNSPLKGWKTSVYEGGIRVPALICWPGKISSQECNTYLAAYDVFPTFLEMAGIGSKTYSSLEGVDFDRLLMTGDSIQDRTIYVRGHLGATVINSGEKLIWSEDSTQSLETYNVDKDPGEQYNHPQSGRMEDVLLPVLEENKALDQ
jgi:arylsulfatase B